MEYIATISSKGQITLPADIRRSLNIHPGDRLSIVKRGKTVSIIPDTYEEELSELRQEIKHHVKAKGLWGKPWPEARQAADKARAKNYGDKYGLRS